jgi:phosphoserine phosphatase
MKPDHVTTPHDVAPETALGALRNHDGPILLDLDETLYLRNSTEDFIDSAWPGLVALLLLRVLDVIKPWRWTGGEATRDVWRVRLIATLLPWTRKRWNARIQGLAARFANQRLLAALRVRETAPIISTTGFQSIVTPLVKALGLPQARIVAPRLTSFADRRAQKLDLVVAALGRETVQRALVLTDSAQDLTLLDACARPLRTIWPEARYRPALSGVYLPGQYVSQVKRPGARYIWRGILQDDFAFWVLTSIALAAVPAMHVLGLLFLLLSFWTIYERGYVDNDLVAARLEADPKLSAEFSTSPVATPSVQPWIWALGSGAIAIWLLRWPEAPVLADFVQWGIVLLATHAWFALYNRFDKGTRVWMFAGLQFARAAAFTALVPITAIGMVALGAHVIAKWVPYCLYRHGGKDWPDAPVNLMRLLFFVVLAVLLAIAEGFAHLLSASAVALLLWTLYRARHEIVAVFNSARRLDRAQCRALP